MVNGYRLFLFLLAINLNALLPSQLHAASGTTTETLCLIRLRAVQRVIKEGYLHEVEGAKYHRGIFQGLMRAEALKEGQLYYSFFSKNPMKIISYDPESKTLIYEFDNVRTTRTLSDGENFFVPYASLGENNWRNLGRAGIEANFEHPEHIPQMMALSAIIGLSKIASHISRDSPVYKTYEALYTRHFKESDKVTIEELTGLLDDFYKETGIDPYKFGAYNSGNSRVVQSDFVDDQQYARDFTPFRPNAALALTGLKDEGRNIGRATSDAMAELAWRTGEARYPRPTEAGFQSGHFRFFLKDYKENNPAKTFKNKEPEFYREFFSDETNKAELDSLISSLKEKHPDKELVILPMPGKSENSTSLMMGTALKDLGYPVSTEVLKNRNGADSTSQKDKNYYQRLSSHQRAHGFVFSTNNKASLDGKIVIILDDVEASGITQDTAMTAVRVNSGAVGVYGLSLFRKL